MALNQKLNEDVKDDTVAPDGETAPAKPKKPAANRHGTSEPADAGAQNRHGTSQPADLSTQNRHGTSEPVD